jgi:hypothetical protein
VFYEPVQLLAWADDIIAGLQPWLVEAFPTLEGAARRVGLRNNQGRTKYMITSQNATYVCV